MIAINFIKNLFKFESSKIPTLTKRALTKAQKKQLSKVQCYLHSATIRNLVGLAESPSECASNVIQSALGELSEYNLDACITDEYKHNGLYIVHYCVGGHNYSIAYMKRTHGAKACT